jgi:hypothetical protein
MKLMSTENKNPYDTGTFFTYKSIFIYLKMNATYSEARNATL